MCFALWSFPPLKLFAAAVDGPDLSIVLGTLCDDSSPYFAMLGASPRLLQDILASHCIPFSGLSYDSCREALSHHMLNGLCARRHGSLCSLVSGVLHPGPFTILVTQTVLQVVTQPSFPLNILRQICLGLGFRSSGARERSELITLFQQHAQGLESAKPGDPSDFFVRLESATKGDLLARAAAHGLPCAGTLADIRADLSEHFFTGACLDRRSDMVACRATCDAAGPDALSTTGLQAYLMAATAHNIPHKWLLKVLEARGIPFEPSTNVAKLRRILRAHIRRLVKGKFCCVEDRLAETAVRQESELNRIRANWPQLVRTQGRTLNILLYDNRPGPGGIVEYQCRGTLHMHNLVFLGGGVGKNN